RVSLLAARTPVGDAVRVALAARADRLAAARARPPGAAVDAVLLPAALHRTAHRGGDPCERRPKLVVGGPGERSPRREPRLPERPRLPLVADPGDEPLVEERIAGLSARIATEVGEHPVEVGLGREDVRPEAGDRTRGQLEHRAVPLARLVPLAAEDEPR